MSLSDDIFQCALCHHLIFFERYEEATQHLGLYHSTHIKFNYKRSGGDGPLLIPLQLAQLRVNVMRLTSQELASSALQRKQIKRSHSKTREVLNKGTRAALFPKGKERVGLKEEAPLAGTEIRLETLRAGEIETLITNLFPLPPPKRRKITGKEGEENKDSSAALRRSSRQTRKRLQVNSFEEFDLDEEEEPLKTSHTKGKKDEEDKEFHPEEEKAKKTLAAEQSSFECSVCAKKFQYERLFIDHMAWHEKERMPSASRPFQCAVCEHRFSKRYNLQRHFISHLEKNPFRCKFPNCGRAFTSEYNVRRHERLHTSRLTFPCTHCSSSYTHKYKLERHVTRFHSSTSKEKPRLYSRKTYHVKSAEQLANLPPDAASLCKKNSCEYDTTATLSIPTKDAVYTVQLEQIKTEEDEILQSEQERLVREMYASDPVLHELRSLDPEAAKEVAFNSVYNRNSKFGDFKCHLCRWEGARAGTLQQHLQKVHKCAMIAPTPTSHNPQEIELLCGSCGYNSKSASDLSNHIQVRHKIDDEKKWGCGDCGKRFPTNKRLARHEREVHRTEKRYACDQCHAKFAQPSFLARHVERVHDPEYQRLKEQSFKCPVCEKVLSSAYALRVHGRTHGGARPLSKCQLCGQTCAGELSLKRHIRYVHLQMKNVYNERARERRLKLIAQSKTPPPAGAEVAGREEPSPNQSSPAKELLPQILGL